METESYVQSTDGLSPGSSGVFEVNAFGHASDILHGQNNYVVKVLLPHYFISSPLVECVV